MCDYDSRGLGLHFLTAAILSYDTLIPQSILLGGLYPELLKKMMISMLRMYEGLCLNNVIFLKRTFLSSIALG